MKASTVRRLLHLEQNVRAFLGGWIGITVIGATLILAIAAYELRNPRMIFPLFLALGAGLLVWMGMNPLETRIAKLLRNYRFEAAFQLAFSRERLSVMVRHFKEVLRLPAEVLRPRIEQAFTELRVLHASVYDNRNTFISPAFKSAMQEGSDNARAALWNICRNLDVVARQEVIFPADHPKVQRLTQVIEQLTHSASEARVKLAELSLGANESEMNEAKAAIENVRRQSEALLELEAALAS